jgi:S1-C subfamily serine protease
VNTFRSADMGLWFRSSNDGLVIRDVASSGPITRLGFREGDVIVSVNGQRVSRERDFVTYLFAEDVREERVKVIVLRDDREEVIWVEPTVFIEEVHVAHHDPLEEFGIIVDDRYDDQVVVLKVFPRSPAYYAGIRAGDVITVFDGHKISSPKEFVTYVRDVRSENVVVKVDRDRKVRELDVEFTSVRDDRREERSERREDRLERRDDRSDRGVRVDVDDDRRDAAPGVRVDTPRGGVQVSPPRGGILPRIRGR